MAAANLSEAAPHPEAEVGTVGRIPVRNLWLLMLYASELFRELGNRSVDVEDNPDEIPDLVAEILCHHVNRRIQRNLSFGYISREAVLGRVRGRIDLLKTEAHRLLDHGKVACRFDELTINTARNRYVRAALELLSSIVGRKTLAHQCRSLASSLTRMGVTGECPGKSELSVDRFGRHDMEDRPMVSAATLAFNLVLPTEASGTHHLLQPDRDLPWIRKLFEKGIAGFFAVTLPSNDWKVKAGRTIQWPIVTKSQGIDQILPSMKTDIELENAGQERRIIIDTKFNSMVTRGWHREESLRSGYLYQIYTYLRTQESDDDPLSNNATGMLLHPSTGSNTYESITLQGHEIRFATVDLSAPTSTIREQLLRVVSEEGLPKCGE
jgi:5-methylcytosine-specific restriction enzyme subunit McrC